MWYLFFPSTFVWLLRVNLGSPSFTVLPLTPEPPHQFLQPFLFSYRLWHLKDFLRSLVPGLLILFSNCNTCACPWCRHSSSAWVLSHQHIIREQMAWLDDSEILTTYIGNTSTIHHPFPDWRKKYAWLLNASPPDPSACCFQNWRVICFALIAEETTLSSSISRALWESVGDKVCRQLGTAGTLLLTSPWFHWQWRFSVSCDWPAAILSPVCSQPWWSI